MRLLRYFIEFIIMFLIMGWFNSCYVVRYFTWNFADVRDYRRFPYKTIQNAPPVFDFHVAAKPVTFSIPSSYRRKNAGESFEDFLSRHKTTAFLVIRDDTILYERYFHGYRHDSVFPSFSVTKSVLSSLAGIALGEGSLKSLEQTVSQFLPVLRDERFTRCTLEDLLNMRSGIRFDEGYYNPFGGMAKFYYGTDLKRYVEHLKMKEEPGLQYKYASCNDQVAAFILECATGEKLPEYLESRLWKPMGMEAPAMWNTDSPDHNNVKAFCCLNARAIDFAKFGRLYLRKGEWDGVQLVPQQWVERSTSIINDSRDSQGYAYTLGWRVLDDGSFFAKGILGQYIYVDRARKLIIIRFGKKYAGIDWVSFFRSLYDQL